MFNAYHERQILCYLEKSMHAYMKKMYEKHALMKSWTSYNKVFHYKKYKKCFSSKKKYCIIILHNTMLGKLLQRKIIVK